MTITLKQEHWDEIRRIGEHEYPCEGCGLLLGITTENRSKQAEKIFRVENSKDEDERHNRSLITPGDLIRGEHVAAESALEVVGNFHSHPDHPAVPSDFDLEHALPVWSYIIVSVSDSSAGEVRSWVMLDDRSRFKEEKLLITKESSTE
ncbi:MAG TPA: M67 family metallopeptidase [Aridibacter sp.]|nr:M67 family metallopeptidase [Aridibacter sp.]